ncbi:MAG: hypothetical protein ACOC6F_03305, partial [bacterium]
HMWLPKLVERALEGGNPALLSTYLRGRADASETEWLQDLLDEWATKREMASLAFEVTWRNEPSERAARRAIDLVDKEWIPPAGLSRLAWGRWPQTLSVGMFRLVLDRLSQDDSAAATEAALAMLLRWLEENPNGVTKVAQEAWTFLERPVALSGQGMTTFYWKNVASRYVSQSPRRIASSTLSIFESEDVVVLQSDERLEVLREALLADPEGVWEQIGEVLLREDELGFRFRLSLREWGVEIAGRKTLLEWAERHRPRGPRILAKMATPLSPLARTLLARYPEDEAVGGAITATFLSGSWWGPESSWLESKLSTARAWCDDPNPAIQDWARELVTMTEQDLKRVRLAEEEEFMRQ